MIPWYNGSLSRILTGYHDNRGVDKIIMKQNDSCHDTMVTMDHYQGYSPDTMTIEVSIR